ncbi:ABSCISIC ACID-INSENSITIVE 5-like protein 2 [Senna tora]|uniref:ABSCISIC ACID-INSENSITIVE 5-like protein 2 n=1 Tax=Senna tora TaxID=362788 RepID=A0A834WDC1_9FABA|nr:ABSCISIC ACID-INSENSITIVE 5-like protein 2 [Senna tora]
MGSQKEATQEPKAPSLTHQGSPLYNLTLDDVQNQLGNSGKPLGSMNLNELLKSVWTVEADQEYAYGSSLNGQGNLTLCGDLNNKTVDEVWRDIQQKKKSPNNQHRKAQGRQEATLGEMTLEDFLVKAGVVASSDSTSVASQQNISQHSHWMQYQQLPSVHNVHHQHQNHHDMVGGFMGSHAVQVQVQQPLPVVVANPVLDSEMMVTTSMSPSSLIGTLSDTQSPGRKRGASGDAVEKTVERRQKRMIKNRESAARSRARKQAYTHELEIKVSNLEEENERLRRQNEIERVLPCAPPPDSKHQLRRTSSSLF